MTMNDNLITFFYVNGSSIFMAFQQTDYYTGQVEWVGFENFETLFKTFFKTTNGSAPFYVAVLNSIEYWALGTFVGLPLGFFFGYFFFKRWISSSSLSFMILASSLTIYTVF